MTEQTETTNKEIAISLLKQIDQLVNEFQVACHTLNNKDRGLVGGLVGGIYSPEGNIGVNFAVGDSIIITGLLESLISENKSKKELIKLMKVATEGQPMSLPTRSKKDMKEEENN